MIRIGPLSVDIDAREIIVDHERVRLGNRAFDILVVLISANGELVSRRKLLQEVWPDTIVEHGNLQVHISALRKLLGERRGLIQTVSGRGYRLLRGGTSGSISMEEELSDAGGLARSSRIPNNLPIYTPTLIGRTKALADVSLALQSARHLTLVGSGGIGKTSLAIEAARTFLPMFPDGIHLVSLASATNSDSVFAAFAACVGLESSSRPSTLSRISHAFNGRRALFVLDNCEHVLEPASELAHRLTSVSGDVRVLATSREPLRAAGEHLYWVSSLEVPIGDNEANAVRRCSAVELFIARARAIDARFSSDEKSVQLIGTVCRRLDGIPLAIELAAARAAILGIEALAGHLDDRFSMLTGGNRTALPRHQTLKATLDWSHGLLDPAEQATLRRLGIFANAFTMDAAAAVARDSTLAEPAVVTALTGLVEKSLVVKRLQSGEATYRLLETTRDYAMQKLGDNGERRDVSMGHARYFLGVLECDESNRGEITPAAFNDWRAHRHELLDDLRAALAWSLSPRGDAGLGERLAVKVVFLLYELSLVEECCDWARRALGWRVVTDSRPRASQSLLVRMQLQSALAAAGVYVDGPNRETFGIWSQILGSAIALGEQTFEALALWGMWTTCQSSGAAGNALAFATRFASLASEMPGASGAVLGYRLLGVASHYAGDQQRARASLEQLLLHHEGAGQHRLPLGRSVDQRLTGRATLARVLWLQGCRQQALTLAAQCAAQACHQQPATVACDVLVEALVPLALLSDKREQAAEAIALLHDVSARVGLKVSQACARCFDEYLHSQVSVDPSRLPGFRAALDDLDSLAFGAPRAMLAGQYCLALGRAGQPGQGIDRISAELKRCDEMGDLWYIGELRRIQGELLLMDLTDGSANSAATRDAEACLLAALEDSIVRGSHSLQLRAAASLGRLWHEQGRSADAADLLASACSSLKEGLDWEDFRAAAELLRSASGAAAVTSLNIGSGTEKSLK